MELKTYTADELKKEEPMCDHIPDATKMVDRIPYA
jgi:hypothetical protein